jgi:hypothetical protein
MEFDVVVAMSESGIQVEWTQDECESLSAHSLWPRMIHDPPQLADLLQDFVAVAPPPIAAAGKCTV